MIERNQDNLIVQEMISENECEEIFEFLSFFNKAEVMKIPEEILNYLNTHRNREFETKIDRNDLFNFNNLSNNALDFLIYIDMTYWKNEQNKIVNNKELFNEKVNYNNSKIVQYKKKNIIEKIFQSIKNLFNNKHE